MTGGLQPSTSLLWVWSPAGTSYCGQKAVSKRGKHLPCQLKVRLRLAICLESFRSQKEKDTLPLNYLIPTLQEEILSGLPKETGSQAIEQLFKTTFPFPYEDNFTQGHLLRCCLSVTGLQQVTCITKCRMLFLNNIQIVQVTKIPILKDQRYDS